MRKLFHAGARVDRATEHHFGGGSVSSHDNFMGRRSPGSLSKFSGRHSSCRRSVSGTVYASGAGRPWSDSGDNSHEAPNSVFRADGRMVDEIVAVSNWEY